MYYIYIYIYTHIDTYTFILYYVILLYYIHICMQGLLRQGDVRHRRQEGGEEGHDR